MKRLRDYCFCVWNISMCISWPVNFTHIYTHIHLLIWCLLRSIQSNYSFMPSHCIYCTHQIGCQRFVHIYLWRLGASSKYGGGVQLWRVVPMNTDCTMLHFAVILSSKFMPFPGGCFTMLQDLGCQCMHLQSADAYPGYVCCIYTFLSCTNENGDGETCCTCSFECMWLYFLSFV